MLFFLTVGVVGLALLVVTLFLDDLLSGVLDFDSAFLSGTSLGGFAAALGATGALVLNAGGSLPVAVAAGVGTGVLVGGIGGLVQRSLVKLPAGVNPSMATVVGRTAAVTAPVGPDALGQVAVRVGSHVNRYTARCDTPVGVGAQVQVVAATSPTAVVVRPLD